MVIRDPGAEGARARDGGVPRCLNPYRDEANRAEWFAGFDGGSDACER